MVNKANKKPCGIRQFLFPGPAAYDEWRSRRIWMWSVIAGLVIALVFGAILYLIGQSRPY